MQKHKDNYFIIDMYITRTKIVSFTLKIMTFLNRIDRVLSINYPNLGQDQIKLLDGYLFCLIEDSNTTNKIHCYFRYKQYCTIFLGCPPQKTFRFIFLFNLDAKFIQ